MVSSMGINCPFDVGFVPRGGGDIPVSRHQLCLPRKLIVHRAKLGQSLLFTYILLFLEARYLPLPAFDVLSDSTLDGSTLVDVIENFPHLPDTEGPVVTVSATSQCGRLDSKRLKAVSRVSEAGSSGSLPPHIIYLIELGLDIEQIKVMAYKFPSFSYYSLEGKNRPLIEFLLDLGVSKSDLPKILFRNPSLCGCSISENLIPTVAFIETLGVDKTKWAKLISRFPGLLTYSRTKIEATVEFLYEVGLSGQSIGKILTRWPQILSCSVENKLRPTTKYFHSLGVDVIVFLRRCPPIIGLSIEDNLKPVTEFFLERAFSIEEVGTMISRFGYLYAYSLKGNMVPKWEFFLTMDYSRQDLIKYPHYFGYSLKERIKPRYNLMKESGVKFALSQLLGSTDKNFELLLKKRIEKLQLEESRN